MTTQTLEYRAAKILRNGTIDCEINHPEFGWIPTTLTEDDPVTFELHAKITADASASSYQETQAEFESILSRRMIELNATAQSAIDAQTPEYPPFEQLTFERQRAEALAFQQDPASPTPSVDAIAFAREIDRTELLSKIISKVGQFESLSCFIAGRRQYYEVQLNSASSIAELDDIEFIFN